eukprot:m.449416 g.449416  ORF g.449416 m.449416 type:complete len:181 (+) comp19816_c0_seq1:193-735(+)
MRPLTEDETKTLFEKLDKYIGDNVKLLVDRPDATYCFRNHLDRVYYVREDIMRRATNFGRDNLLALGTRLGKFSKKGKFRLHITALAYIAPYAKYKVWVKPNTEQSFLYGNHVAKAGLGRMTENTPKYQGVVVYNMNDVPLGFGATAFSTEECRSLDPTRIVVFHQADLGEYLRDEESLT